MPVSATKPGSIPRSQPTSVGYTKAALSRRAEAAEQIENAVLTA
jgi:hypothetical protein